MKHLVFSSVLHAIEDRLLQHRSKLAIERRIIVSDLNWTILQPTNYMLPAWSYPVFKSEVFRLWWSLDRRQSLIVLDDYAEVAAKVILEGAAHHGATYELSSGDCLTAYEIAERFATVTGRPVRAEEVSPDEFMVRHRKHHAMQALLDAGQTVTSADFPYEFEVFRAIGACYSESDFVGNPNVLTWLLGRTPTTVEEYLRKEYARFQAAA